jgi:hypothetical protein
VTQRPRLIGTGLKGAWRVLLIVLVGASSILLAFLVADFADRIRHRIYSARDLAPPVDDFRRNVAVAIAAVLLLWVVFAYS